MNEPTLPRREFLEMLAGAFAAPAIDWEVLPTGPSPARGALDYDAVVVGSGLAGLSCAAAALDAAKSASRARRPSLLRRPAIAIPVTLALVAAIAAAGWLAFGARQRTLARARLAEVETLVSRHELVRAWLLIEELRPILGEDRELERQRMAISRTETIRTEPPGAEISFRGYLDDPAVWHPLGASPVERLRLPATALVFRARRPEFEEAQGAPYLGLLDEARTIAFALVPAGSAPEGMVRIPAVRTGELHPAPERVAGAAVPGFARLEIVSDRGADGDPRRERLVVTLLRLLPAPLDGLGPQRIALARYAVDLAGNAIPE